MKCSRLLRYPLAAAAVLATPVAGGGEDSAATRLYGTVEYLTLSSGPTLSVQARRVTDAARGAELSVSFLFGASLFGDGLSRHGDCSLPPSALTIAWNQGSSGGTALLAFDLTGPGVTCSPGSLATRLELAFVPLKEATGQNAYHMRSHSSRIVFTGGYRYHVQSQDEAWMNTVRGTVDGVAFSISEAYRASLVTHTTTEVQKVQ